MRSKGHKFKKQKVRVYFYNSFVLSCNSWIFLNIFAYCFNLYVNIFVCCFLLHTHTHTHTHTYIYIYIYIYIYGVFDSLYLKCFITIVDYFFQTDQFFSHLPPVFNIWTKCPEFIFDDILKKFLKFMSWIFTTM